MKIGVELKGSEIRGGEESKAREGGELEGSKERRRNGTKEGESDGSSRCLQA